MAARGRFITVEGGEGSGKSTLIGGLSGLIRESGQEVVETREPGAGEFGARIRAILLDGPEIPDRSELFLFLADRSAHVETVIRPAVSRGAWVICDRFVDSTCVYQGIARGLDLAFVESANQFAVGGLMPDRTLLLDIDPQTGLSRVQDENRLDREPLEFHQKVREGFLELARRHPARIKLVDASQPAEKVLTDCWALLSAYLVKNQ